MSYYGQKERPIYYDYIGAAKRINLFALLSQIVLLIAFAAILFLPVFKGEVLIDTETTETANNAEENKTTIIKFSYFDDIKSVIQMIVNPDSLRGNYSSEFSTAYVLLMLLLSLEIAALVLINNIFLCIYRIYRPKKEAMLKYHRIKTLGFVKESIDPAQRSALMCFLAFCVIATDIFIIFHIKDFLTDPLPLDAISIRKMPCVTGVTQYIWVIPALFLLFIIIRAIQRHFESSMTILVRGEKERRFEKFTRHYSLEK